MPKVEHVTRSHGVRDEYQIILNGDELIALHLAFEDIAEGEHLHLQNPILTQIANALHLLDDEKFPTPFN